MTKKIKKVRIKKQPKKKEPKININKLKYQSPSQKVNIKIGNIGQQAQAEQPQYYKIPSAQEFIIRKYEEPKPIYNINENKLIKSENEKQVLKEPEQKKELIEKKEKHYLDYVKELKPIQYNPYINKPKQDEPLKQSEEQKEILRPKPLDELFKNVPNFGEHKQEREHKEEINYNPYKRREEEKKDEQEEKKSSFIGSNLINVNDYIKQGDKKHKYKIFEDEIKFNGVNYKVLINNQNNNIKFKNNDSILTESQIEGLKENEDYIKWKESNKNKLNYKNYMLSIKT